MDDEDPDPSIQVCLSYGWFGARLDVGPSNLYLLMLTCLPPLSLLSVHGSESKPAVPLSFSRSPARGSLY